MSKFTQSKFFMATLSIFLLISTLALWREISSTIRVKKEVERLETRATELEEKNNNLKSLADYLVSDDYREKAARENLNLQLPGEVAVALPEEEVKTDSHLSQGRPSDFVRTETFANFESWFNYFFAPK